MQIAAKESIHDPEKMSRKGRTGILITPQHYKRRQIVKLHLTNAEDSVVERKSSLPTGLARRIVQRRELRSAARRCLEFPQPAAWARATSPACSLVPLIPIGSLVPGPGRPALSRTHWKRLRHTDRQGRGGHRGRWCVGHAAKIRDVYRSCRPHIHSAHGETSGFELFPSNDAVVVCVDEVEGVRLGVLRRAEFFFVRLGAFFLIQLPVHGGQLACSKPTATFALRPGVAKEHAYSDAQGGAGQRCPPPGLDAAQMLPQRGGRLHCVCWVPLLEKPSWRQDSCAIWRCGCGEQSPQQPSEKGNSTQRTPDCPSNDLLFVVKGRDGWIRDGSSRNAPDRHCSCGHSCC